MLEYDTGIPPTSKMFVNELVANPYRATFVVLADHTQSLFSSAVELEMPKMP